MRAAGSAHAYVRAIVVNRCRVTLRRQLLERLHRTTCAALVDDRDVAQSMDVRNALAALPPRKRACVVLRYYADLSEVETAAALGISVGTVKSQTAKALAQLSRALGESPAQRQSMGDGVS